jgi:hypothetical protein
MMRQPFRLISSLSTIRAGRTLALVLSGFVMAVHVAAAEHPDWRSAILNGQIKAFCSDFNWGPGGRNGFAKPGLWASRSP